MLIVRMERYPIRGTISTSVDTIFKELKADADNSFPTLLKFTSDNNEKKQTSDIFKDLIPNPNNRAPFSDNKKKKKKSGRKNTECKKRDGEDLDMLDYYNQQTEHTIIGIPGMTGDLTTINSPSNMTNNSVPEIEESPLYNQTFFTKLNTLSQDNNTDIVDDKYSTMEYQSITSDENNSTDGEHSTVADQSIISCEHSTVAQQTITPDENKSTDNAFNIDKKNANILHIVNINTMADIEEVNTVETSDSETTLPEWKQLTLDNINTSFKVVSDLLPKTKLRVIDSTHLAAEGSYISALSRYRSGQDREKIISFIDHICTETDRHINELLSQIKNNQAREVNINNLQQLMHNLSTFLHRYDNMRSVYQSDSSSYARLGNIRNRFFNIISTFYRTIFN